MKKTFLYLAFALFAAVSCREDEPEIIPEVSIETQNTYDDQAAQLFLKSHAFDAKGNLITYKESDSSMVKLADLNPIVLPSGVIYLVRTGAQPVPGEAIGPYDLIRIMHNTLTYVALDAGGKAVYESPFPFRNTIAGTGVPEVDPSYFYVKKADLEIPNIPDIAKERKFYEIEGFQEALKFFRAYDIPDDADYNMQGVIIVPSRAAFARDLHFNYSGISFRNRSFVFNFQIYKATHFSEPR